MQNINRKMNKLYLLWLVNVSVSIVVNSQRVFRYKNGNNYVEKIYFHGRTNEDDVNLRNLNNAFTNAFINDKSSNHIDDEDENTEQRYSHSSSTESAISNLFVDKMPTMTTTNELDDNNDNPSFIKGMMNKIPYSSKETNETINTTMSSNPRNSQQAIQRIPPPSLMESALTKSNLRVCEIKYAEYVQRIFPQESEIASDANDEALNGRILAAPGEYPHMSAIGFPSYNDQMDYKCGGSLISEHFVITAAHCANFTGLQPTKVRIGDLNLMVEESYLEPQIRNIKNIYVHPDYKTTSYYNDIAILELDKEVELTEFVRPIRLWTQETLPFTTAYAMGYGATSFARERTNRLTNLNMTIVPNNECNREMAKFPETERGILSSQLCARDYALNRDTCQGDSGGPLQLNIRGRKSKSRIHYQLIGITSYGLYCRSGFPSIFTRVCSYLDWIEHIVWKDYFV